MTNLRLEKQSEKEQIVVIPLNASLQLMDNKDKHPLTHLVLSLSQDGAITKGNIIQYVPKEGVATSLPQNTFAKLFSHQKLDCDGRFTVLSLAGLYKYDLSFQGGQLRQLREASKKGNQLTTQSTQRTCIHWYLITTTYWTDGTETVEYDDLGITCDDCGIIGPSGQGTLCDELEDGSGGGGNIDYVYEMTKRVNWLVNEGNIGDSTWSIKSYDMIKGFYNQASGGSGHFVSSSHVRSVLSNTNTNFEIQWSESSGSAVLDNCRYGGECQSVNCSVSGTISFPGSSFPNINVTNSLSWSPSTVYNF